MSVFDSADFEYTERGLAYAQDMAAQEAEGLNHPSLDTVRARRFAALDRDVRARDDVIVQLKRQLLYVERRNPGLVAEARASVGLPPEPPEGQSGLMRARMGGRSPVGP